MKLAELLQDLPSPILKIKGTTHRKITRILSSFSYDFDEQGSFPKDNNILFVHLGPLLEQHILDYQNHHVNVLVVDRDVEMPSDVTVIRVMNTFETLGLLAGRLFDHPSRHLTLVGVTGTNGKTTTTHLIENILKAAGKKTALFGTLQYRLGASPTADAASDPHHLTTPLPEVFNKMLVEARQKGISHVVMEVSSQSLREHRLKGCNFDVAVFTNLSREHQDYHLDMHDYTESKLRLFTEILPASNKSKRTAVLNLSDAKVKLLSKRLDTKRIDVLGFAKASSKNPLQKVEAGAVKISEDGIRATVKTPKGVVQVNSPLLGSFNFQNILAAISATLALDIPIGVIERGIKKTTRIPGRLERIPNDLGIKTYFDWAHTEQAFAETLKTLKQWKGKGKLRVLFGCEDNMDAEKRKRLAFQAGKFGNALYISLENLIPEEAAFVKKQMEMGLKKTRASRLYFSDPMQALKRCLKDCKKGDTAVAIGWEVEHVAKAKKWLRDFRK